MANSQQNTLASEFTNTVERINNLENIAIYARRGWELCACCRVTLGKAASFFGQDNLILHESLTCIHYPQFEFLLESARTCGLCNLFLYSLKHAEKPEEIADIPFPNRFFEILLVRSQFDTPTPILVKFFMDHESGDTLLPTARSLSATCGEIEGLHWYGTDICWSSIPDVLKFPSIKSYYIERQPNVKTALGWIKHCNENHSTCAKYRREKCLPLPSRVIDVGASNSSDEPHLFISNGQRAPYICLSHCWGDAASDLIKTTEDNLESRRMQIPLATLPRTFADAVRITRALDIRYLWIDSICIIQDSANDWQFQAAAMASIYRNAYVTIAATASKDFNGGCLRPRKPFTLLRRPQAEPKELLTSSEAILFYPNSMATIYNLFKAPLYTRGWTLQEMILSCRTLHFCEEQMLWHCLERTVTEDGVVDVPGFNQDHEHAAIYYRHLGIKGGAISDIKDTDSLRYYWWSVVEEFTSRSLTKITDRLAALSGIIDDYQERTGDTPVAGLWKSDLPFGLLWQSASRIMTRPQALHKVPTWSWVALDGPIRNELTIHSGLLAVSYGERRSSIQDQVVIIAAEIHHSGPISASPIIGGLLTLDGRLQSAFRSREGIDHRILTVLRDQDTSFFRLLAQATPADIDVKSHHIGWCKFDRDPPPADQILWCLEVSISERESSVSLDPFEEVPAPARTHDVLILGSAENANGTFQRLGVGMIHAGKDVFKQERSRVNLI